MQLRDYQIEIAERVESDWCHGPRSVMCQIPTGTGKSVIMAYLIKSCLSAYVPPSERGNIASALEAYRSTQEKMRFPADVKRQVLVVSHRREINEQLYHTIYRLGLDKELQNGSVRVESIQKLARELKEPDEGSYKDFSPLLICIDEAHHAIAKTYQILWNRWPSARFLGMTATPCRLKAEGFSDLFNKLATSWQPYQFIYAGWLSTYEYVTVKENSPIMKRVRDLKKHGPDGDYQAKELSTAIDNGECIEQLYQAYRRFASGKKGIIYAVSVEHGKHITDYYAAQGENIVLITGKTPVKERKRLVDGYRQGEIQILVSVDCFGEGFDCPEIQFIQLARPTLSLSKYLQQVGRGLRPHTDKSTCIILDNVGLCYRFGLPDQDRDWQTMFSEGQGRYKLEGSSKPKMGSLWFLAHHHIPDVDSEVDPATGMFTLVSRHDFEEPVLENHNTMTKVKEQLLRSNNNKWYSRESIRSQPDWKYHEVRGDYTLYLDQFGKDVRFCLQKNNYSIDFDNGYSQTLYGNVVSFTADGVAHYIDGYTSSDRWLDWESRMSLPEKPQFFTKDWLSFIDRPDGLIPRIGKPSDDVIFKKEDVIALPPLGNELMLRDARNGRMVVIFKEYQNSAYRVLETLADGSKVLMKIIGARGYDGDVFIYKNGAIRKFKPKTSQEEIIHGRWTKMDKELGY